MTTEAGKNIGYLNAKSINLLMVSVFWKTAL